jgi:hypothetical protein
MTSESDPPDDEPTDHFPALVPPTERGALTPALSR